MSFASKVRAEVGVIPGSVRDRDVAPSAYLPLGEGWVMVCAVERTTRIAGGFVLVPVAQLMRAWRMCRSKPLGIADFRAWLACREMVARRCHVYREWDRSPTYEAAELARLLGVSERRARASARKLEAAGLLQFQAEAIEFPEPVGKHEGEVDTVQDTIGRGRGSVAIPRRLLRFIAAGARPALIATVLGLLLRCLSRREAGWDGRGRIKVSWVASTFGVDDRRVKQARKELVTLGWIAPEPSGQRIENKHGRAFRIDLDWDRPRDGVEPDGRSLPPLPAEERSRFATPSSDQEPLRERIQNQEPAEGPAGARLDGEEVEGLPPTAPSLDDVQIADLGDTGRLLQLHDQAVARGLVTASEADRLRVVAAAEHALAVGRTNPAGLFVYLIRGSCWRYVTGEDENLANARIKAHLRGPEPPRASPAMTSLGSGTRPSSRDVGPPRACVVVPPLASSRPVDGLSEDARVVREIRAACIRAGIYRDPWPSFEARNPAWDRARWDRAMVELGLA